MTAKPTPAGNHTKLAPPNTKGPARLTKAAAKYSPAQIDTRIKYRETLDCFRSLFRESGKIPPWMSLNTSSPCPPENRKRNSKHYFPMNGNHLLGHGKANLISNLTLLKRAGYDTPTGMNGGYAPPNEKVLRLGCWWQAIDSGTRAVKAENDVKLISHQSNKIKWVLYAKSLKTHVKSLLNIFN